MLIGSSTSHKLQIVTASGGASIDFEFDVISVSTASPPVVDGSAFGFAPPAANPITTATTTDAVTGAASLIKRVMRGNVRNAHASATETVTLQKTDGTETATVIKVTLLAGESLAYNGGSWLHYDVNGALYPSVGNAATQAEMEAGTSTSKYVTPQGVNWHPGACKCWGKANGAGTSLVVNWNVTSITDTGTGQLTVNIGTDFSSADYSAVTSVERVSTSLAVANVDNGGMFRNATMAAGSFQIENYDDTATTHVAQDPSSYFWACFGDQA